MAFRTVLDRVMGGLRGKPRGTNGDKGMQSAESGLELGAEIDLEQVDPVVFETLCAEIFGRYYNAEVDDVQNTHDCGKDLIVHLPSGDMLVECKHWGGTVSRQVVQKLDSAVGHEGAVEGMVVTTGIFSKGAIDYAAECCPPVVLVDLAELQRIALSVGIVLTVGGAGGAPEYCCRASSTDRLYDHIAEELNDDLESYPEEAGALMERWRRITEYRPFYLTSYRVDAEFPTASGPFAIQGEGQVLVDVEGRRLLDDGRLIDDILSRSVERGELPLNAPSRDPRAVRTSIESVAGELVSDSLAETTGYYGANKAFYTKLCRPSPKDVEITDVRKIMVADTDLEYRILGTEYSRELMDIDGAERWDDDPGYECGICGEEICGRPMLCTICGRVVHSDPLMQHGAVCSGCGRTMCIECAQVHSPGAQGMILCPSCLAAIESQDAEIDYAIDSSAGIDCYELNPTHPI